MANMAQATCGIAMTDGFDWGLGGHVKHSPSGLGGITMTDWLDQGLEGV